MVGWLFACSNDDDDGSAQPSRPFLNRLGSIEYVTEKNAGVPSRLLLETATLTAGPRVVDTLRGEAEFLDRQHERRFA